MAQMKDVTISMISHGKDTDTTPVDLNQALADIGSNRWAKEVARVREVYEANGGGQTGKDAAAPLKLRLPGFLFSGTFKTRHDSQLIQHSGLICCDLDHLGASVGAIKEQVCADRHVLAAFLSPTGTGLKVILRVDPTRKHKEESFIAAEQFMMERFGLEIDGACDNLSRICYVSHDPEIFIAEDAEVIPYPPPVTEYKPTPQQYTNGTGTGTSPGDEYNERGDWENVLLNHGWSKVGRNAWRRPEKTEGISATWDRIAELPKTFYCFSSSTEFQQGKAYRPFSIYALLECGGDFHVAAKKLAARGFGKQGQKPKPLPLDRFIEESRPDKTPDEKTEAVVARPLIAFTYPTEDDPNILLGKDDYLGRGGGMLFVSHAGAGKSSWVMDACLMWGLGKPWMGIRCSKPLRSLIIQAEDSDRYMGKIAASFAYVNKLTPAETHALSENVLIARVKGVSGAAFFAEVKRLTDLHQPDLVIVNPIYLYAEGDIGRSEFAQPFLLGLDAINKEEKFAYILIHHTGKPQAKNNKGQRAEVEDWESAYMGFGSSYLANWPRCTALLEPVAGESGRFLIKLGKGGLNAGVTKEVDQGAGTRTEPCTRIAIKHSADKMEVGGKSKPVYYWQIDDTAIAQEQTTKSGRPTKYQLRDYLYIIPKHNEPGKTKNVMLKFATDDTGIKETAFRDLLNDAVKDGYLVKTMTPSGFVFNQPAPTALPTPRVVSDTD